MLNKYLKYGVWRLALRHDIYIYMSLSFKRLKYRIIAITYVKSNEVCFLFQMEDPEGER